MEECLSSGILHPTMLFFLFHCYVLDTVKGDKLGGLLIN